MASSIQKNVHIMKENNRIDINDVETNKVELFQTSCTYDFISRFRNALILHKTFDHWSLTVTVHFISFVSTFDFILNRLLYALN